MTQQLSLPRDMCGSIKPLSLDQTMKRGMGPKKCHEVSQMSGVVTEVCRSCSCSLVLDVGAGLVSNASIFYANVHSECATVYSLFYFSYTNVNP